MDSAPARIVTRAPDGSPVIEVGRGDVGPVFLVQPCNLLVLCPEGYDALHGTKLIDSIAGCDHPLIVVDSVAGIADAIQTRREALGPVFEPDWGPRSDQLNPLAVPWLPAEGQADYLASLAAILTSGATRPLLAEFLTAVMDRRSGLARLVLGYPEDPSLSLAARIAARLLAGAEDPATAAQTAEVLRECGIAPALARRVAAEGPRALAAIDAALAQFRDGRRSARSRNIDFETLRRLDPATVFLCHGDAAGGACSLMAMASLCAQLRVGAQDRELTIVATLDHVTPRMARMLMGLMAEGRERGVSVVLCLRGIGHIREAGPRSGSALRTLLDAVLCLGPPEEETAAWLTEAAAAAVPWRGAMHVLEQLGLRRRYGGLQARLAGLGVGRGMLFQAGQMGAPIGVQTALNAVPAVGRGI